MSPRALNLSLGWLLAVLAMAAFALAGRWQLDRMHQKEAMLAAAATALAQGQPQPLLLASDPGRREAYDRAEGAGRIANATVWLDNQMREGRSGVRMYCVLFADEGVQPMLLDAGWWPLDGRRTLPEFGCPAGDAQAVRGLLAPPPSTGIVHGEPMAPSGDARWLAARLDLPALSRALKLSTGLAPRVLRLDPERKTDDAGVMLAPGERDLDILANTLTPQRHLGYAVQWFGLAIMVLVVALVLTLRKKR
ncbi:MAG TPA: SURF1 family protein [Thermomonas sp.]|jgi:surfeit locus 1 family protein|uniref:SURF1 family protein n=1 Tax=Thermomonas sp. TaxID=1971895 RepID=UPI002C417E1A|nr:SURF1 family protein [Thermomonas sp.]HOZ23587.1 SURF1 family protein [Thermomonas sp.]HPM67872.1 SURF1 family protein [Piscinibacter sp.]